MNCPKCQSTQIIKYGHTHNGKPRFRCQDCGRQFVKNPGRPPVDESPSQQPVNNDMTHVSQFDEPEIDMKTESMSEAANLDTESAKNAPESTSKTANSKSNGKTNKDIYTASKIILLVLLITVISSFFVIIGAGQRGVAMRFGKVQENILGEGLHIVIPIVDTVQKLSVRVQSQEIYAEASSKDLQDVFTDIAVNWHIIPEEANDIFQQIGDERSVVERIINPAVEEVLKAVIARYTAEEVITQREEVKAKVDTLLIARLATYHIAVDDISLVHVHFSKRFGDAVEMKQVAEQEAKRAGFMAVKAAKQAEATVNSAKGEAEAQKLIRETLTPELLQKQAIQRWDGDLPLIVGDESAKLIDLNQFVKRSQDSNPYAGGKH